MPTNPQSPSTIVPAYAFGALAAWLLSVLCHDWGTTMARVYFDWASKPGVLDPAGGTAGFHRGEYLLALVLLLPVAALFVQGVRHLHRLPLARLAVLATPWLLWSVLVYMAWAIFVVFASELVHFLQYGLIGALVALAFDRGRRPQAAFLAVVLLGFVDELWQHYILHRWWLQEFRHWLDWSDPVLNALGACGGVLPFVTWRAAKSRPGRDQTQLIWWAVAAVAVLLLPLLLLDPVSQSRLMGHYPTFPFWSEFANHKAVYWPQPRQGIPIFLASVLLLGILLGPGRPFFTRGAMVAICAFFALTIDPPTRREGRPLHAEVPVVLVPRIGAEQDAVLRLDGVLDESVWSDAPRLGPLFNGVDAKDHIVYMESGIKHEQAVQETYVRLLWDDEALYVAFEVSDTDIWVRSGSPERHDESVKIFIDNGADEITYYVFSVDAANTLYDYFSFVPAAPMDFSPWNRHIGLPHWEARGVKTAVYLQGTMSQEKSWNERPFTDIDTGYTVEMAIPWENFRTTSVPGGQAIRQSVQPRPGERWRLGLFRVEYPRLSAEVLEAAVLRDEGLMDAAAGRAFLGDEVWDERVRRGNLRLRPESGNRVPTRDVLWQHMGTRRVYQAWAPPYNTSFHDPTRFGVMEFVDGPTAASQR